MPISTSAASAALADSFAERRHFTEASAAVCPEGGVVHIADLVLRDSGMDVRTATCGVTRAMAVLRARRLAPRRDGQGLLTPAGIDALRGGRSSVAELRVDRPEAVYEFGWAEDERLEESQAIVKQTERLPALTAAAIAFNVWCRIAPLQRAPCVESLLVCALLKAPGKTRHHLLGLNAGLRPHTYRRAHLHDLSQRLAAFLEGVRTAAELAHKDLHRLSLAQERFSLKLKGWN